MPRTILLVGAPSNTAVKNDLENGPRHAQLLDRFLPSFGDAVQFLLAGEADINSSEKDSALDSFNAQTSKGSSTTLSTESQMRPAWRVLPLEKKPLATGYSQRDWLRSPLGSGSLVADSFGQGGDTTEEDSDAGIKKGEATLNECLTVTYSVRRAAYRATALKRNLEPDVIDNQAPGLKKRRNNESNKEEEKFLEKSYALHDAPVSSQIVHSFDTDRSTRSSSNDLSILTSSSSQSKTRSEALHSFRSSPDTGSLTASLTKPMPKAILRSPLYYLRQAPTPLIRLPTAAQLHAQIPQTLTVTLLVGIIALHPPRRIHLRRTGRAVDLIEAVVGDDTEAGFGISFWVDPVSSSFDYGYDISPLAQRDMNKQQLPQQENSNEDELRNELAGLRVGDVILLQCVALAQYRGRVYGQSLGRRNRQDSNIRRPMNEGTKRSWWRTSAWLMYRQGYRPRTKRRRFTSDENLDVPPQWDSDALSEDEQAGEVHVRSFDQGLLDRGKIVRQWVRQFVGGTMMPQAGNKEIKGSAVAKPEALTSRKRKAPLPPDDTPL